MRKLLETLQLACGTSLIVMFLSGCVWGVNKVEITHGPLSPIKNKRDGIIGVKPFTDGRKGDRLKIGTVYSAAGAVGSVEIKSGARLEDIFTGYMVETLKYAGYQAVSLDSSTSGTNFSAAEKIPVFLEGIIATFWENTMVVARSQVEVSLLLRDTANGHVLWSATIYGYGKSTLWIGAQSEFEDSIRQAVDEALNQAATAFVSDAFYEKVIETHSPPMPSTIH